MDELLANTGMDRLDKMERLEALLTSAVSSARSPDQCNCFCHSSINEKSSTASQTISTGDIVLTGVYSIDNSANDKILLSPKRCSS